MPNKSRRRRSRLIVAPLQGSMALGTLGEGIVISSPIENSTLDRELFVISGDVQPVLVGATAQEGPIYVGVAHGDLSVTEIKEALEADALDQGDQIAQERARRKVRQFGVFMVLLPNSELNDGLPVRVKIKFVVEAGNVLNIFCYNRSGSQLTTGAILKWTGKLYCKAI